MTALGALLPSILLTAGVLAVLFADAAAKGRRPLLLPWISGTALVAVAAVALAWLAGDRLGDRVVLGALRMDAFTAVLTLFCAVAGLVSILATLVGDGNARPGGEFHALVLCAVVGMTVLAAAVDMVTLYLAFELVSITGYVLVGMRRADRLANEAAMKYVLFGAVCSGLMVYGLSLLFGLAGGTSLEALRAAVAAGASSQPVFLAAGVRASREMAPWNTVVSSLTSTPMRSRLAAKSLTSPPLQKALPVPVTTMARTAASSSAAIAALQRSRPRARSSAL